MMRDEQLAALIDTALPGEPETPNPCAICEAELGTSAPFICEFCSSRVIGLMVEMWRASLDDLPRYWHPATRDRRERIAGRIHDRTVRLVHAAQALRPSVHVGAASDWRDSHLCLPAIVSVATALSETDRAFAPSRMQIALAVSALGASS